MAQALTVIVVRAMTRESLTTCVVVLLLTLAPPSGAGEEKRRTSFTDADLESYASRRQKEARPAPEPSPPSEPMSPAPRPVAAPEVFQPPHVVLDDLLGTLLPADKQRAESIGDGILNFYGGSLQGPIHIATRNFMDEAAFRTLVQQVYGSPVNVIGFYYTSEDEIVVGPSSERFKTLVHEMNHFLVEKIVPNPPTWLNEGLSEFFEEASLDPEGLKIRLPAWRQRSLQRWKNGGQQPNLSGILQMTPQDVLAHGEVGSYLLRALAWSIVDFLTSTESGRALFQKYLTELNARRTGSDPYTAMVMAYSGSIRQFEAEWLKHVDRRLGGT